MKLYYFVREYSESESFPDVHIFGEEQEARATMIAKVCELRATMPGAWITEDLDGDSITHCLKGSRLGNSVNTLNVQRDGGEVDMFRLMSQEVVL